MPIKFSPELLELIHLLHDHNRFVRTEARYIRMTEEQTPIDDALHETRMYFQGINYLPIGLPKNGAAFNAIMNYPDEIINNLDNMEVEQLQECTFWF